MEKIIKLQVKAGSANPAPPIGPALGQHGVNIMEFCKQFNDTTKDMEKGMPLPVVISVAPNKSFTFEIKTPPASYLIAKLLNIQSGSKAPGRDNLSVTINREQAKKVAEMKMKDLNTDNVESAINSILGTARSMGIKESL